MPIYKHRLEKDIDIHISVYDLAMMFSNLDAAQMAEFWEELSCIVRSWPGPYQNQWHAMRMELEKKYPNGLRVFQDMAEYAEGDFYGP